MDKKIIVLLGFLLISLIGFSQRVITSEINNEIEKDNFTFLYIINGSEKFEELEYLEIPSRKQTTLEVIVFDKLSITSENCKLTYEFPFKFYKEKRLSSNDIVFVFYPEITPSPIVVRKSYDLMFYATNGEKEAKRYLKLNIGRTISTNHPPKIISQSFLIWPQ